VDDLISRKVAIESIKDPVVKGFALNALKSVPSVPAVPLDKLCEWMADNVYLKDATEAAWELNSDNWKKLLTKWMEEQDATD
jgi:hypothetical protein